MKNFLHIYALEKQMEKFKNYIDGAWVEPQTGEYFKDISPANIDDVIGEFPLSGQGDVNTAVAAAKEAYKSWKKIPAPKRGEYFNKIGDILVRRKKELARIMTREMGKPTSKPKAKFRRSTLLIMQQRKSAASSAKPHQASCRTK